MNNVFLDELPTEWEGYELNTWYQIGIQLMLAADDPDLSNDERAEAFIYLLFANDDGTLRNYPKDSKALGECVKWFLNGWHHDKQVAGENDKKKLIDFDVDQWRIYADFIQIYRIDLADSDMHWWRFQGLLWNMPSEQSSFLQVIQLRTKKPRKGASAEERRQIKEAHMRYDLKYRVKQEKTLTTEDKSAIDEYDRRMAEMKRKKAEEEALEEFKKL